MVSGGTAPVRPSMVSREAVGTPSRTSLMARLPPRRAKRSGPEACRSGSAPGPWAGDPGVGEP